MPSVVFLRGVNVGGHRTFQPSAFAQAIKDLDVVNVGAAGTFVVRKTIGQSALREKFLEKLPFDAEMMICSARELIQLAGGDAFGSEPATAEARRYVSVMAKRPPKLPPLPLCQPAGDEWQVKVIGITGKFALSLNRRTGRKLVYPNEVVEKKLGVPATTRNWDTIEAVCEVLKAS